MERDRRQFLTGAASLALWCGATTYLAPARDEKRTRLILLGTKGGPRVGEERNNPSTLLLINDTPYLVDCGYGATRQLLKAGVPINKLRYIFITHHHSDHNLEYGALLNNAWATGSPMRVEAYGPPGLEKMTHDFFEYLTFDIETRIVDEGRPDLRKLVGVHEFARPGVVLLNDEVKVSA